VWLEFAKFDDKREIGDKPVQVALLCIKTGEQISGLNKICYDNCAGSEAAITVKSYELCPINGLIRISLFWACAE
jgi:hypothetical protein